MNYDELVKVLRNMSKMGAKYGMAVVKMQEAADAIEELSKPRWIPVTERLPGDTHPVLVTYLGYNDKLPRSDMVAMYDDGDWYWYDDESKCKVIVTHWMPLPEPPKEET